MNKKNRIINSLIKESLYEKSEELHNMIQDEDWNPNGPVNISAQPTDIAEEDDMETEISSEDDQTCKFHMDNFGPNDERTKRFCKGEITEKLYGNQKNLDKNKNNKLDKKDFELLRKSKGKKEVEEIDLSKLKKGRKYKYKSPSFEDELEYDDEKKFDLGEPMHSFKGKKSKGYSMGKKDVERFVSDFDKEMSNLQNDEIGEGIGYYDNIDSDDFHEKTGGMYQSKKQDIEEPKPEDVPFTKRRGRDDEYIDFEEMKPNEKKSFFSRMKNKLGLGETDEMEEGNAFTRALVKARKSGDDEFKVGGKRFETKEGKYNKKHVKESIELTESEMIDLIEKIVLEQKSDKSFGGKKPKGMAETEKAQKGSKKENEDYIKSVTKKLKDYLKDGSKGGYETNPEQFPKGNGELAKMEKMAYKPDNATSEYIENFTAAGQENLVYDEIHPDEDRVSSNIEGSSKTGNNPKWANAVETGVNKKRNQIRKDNLLGAVKQMAYNKAPQPVVDDAKTGVQGKFNKNFGKDAGKKATKILNQLESTNPKDEKLLSEEFDKMKNLMNYNKTTQ